MSRPFGAFARIPNLLASQGTHATSILHLRPWFAWHRPSLDASGCGDRSDCSGGRYTLGWPQAWTNNLASARAWGRTPLTRRSMDAYRWSADGHDLHLGHLLESWRFVDKDPVGNTLCSPGAAWTRRLVS